MSGWLIVFGYGLAWLASAVWISRALLPRIPGPQYCHGEALSGSGHVWSNVTYCHQYCKPGCWRRDAPSSIPTIGEFAVCSIVCLIWPLIIPPAAAYLIASKQPTKPVSTADEIARLERELREMP